MDDDLFFMMSDEEDRDFLETIYKAGKYAAAKEHNQNYLEALIKAERIGIDPENVIEELKKLSAARLVLYEAMLQQVREKLANEF
tara:strand:+ start:797 stop:1051 length:255 start_codon:yes stop_codon:yes gene_type:complete